MKRTLLAIAAIIGFALIASSLAPQRRIAPLSSTSSASSSTAAVAATVVSSSNVEMFPVVKVIDGDTLVVNIAGTATTLRLIGLDTPETVDPRKPVQCFGKAASDKAKELLSGKSVAVEYDPSQGRLDKYGRTLAYIYMEDGVLYNEYMIAEGFGHEYTYNLPYKYQEEFQSAEAAARAQKRGLWADNACAAQSARGKAPASGSHVATSTAFTPTKQYDCSRNAYNCSNFASQAEAQYVFELCGGDANDIHQLDRDRDGKVCESLP